MYFQSFSHSALRSVRAMSACLGLVAAVSANASIITQNTSGQFATGGNGFILGQSVTTSADGPWDHITFNFVDTTNQAFAKGSLFLLSQAYGGTAGGLNSSTLGFIASTSTINAGAWDFDATVKLAASTQYFLYMNTAMDGSKQLLFSGTNSYAGGYAYQANDAGSNFVGVTSADLAFSMNGSAAAVPEPATLALVSIALLGIAAARRRGGAPQQSA